MGDLSEWHFTFIALVQSVPKKVTLVRHQLEQSLKLVKRHLLCIPKIAIVSLIGELFVRVVVENKLRHFHGWQIMR
jgi:hypothetical protein